MSMISEFVKTLRLYASEYNESPYGREIEGTEDLLKEAADIIDELSTKLASANKERIERYYKDVTDTNVGKNLSENLIEKIKFGIEASNINDDYTTGLRNGMRYCLALIDGKEPKFESCKQGWISCEEVLPGKYCHCLVTRRNEYEDGYDTDVREDVYLEIEGVWDWQSKFEGLHDEIVAWQPLPEPYKGE